MMTFGSAADYVNKRYTNVFARSTVFTGCRSSWCVRSHISIDFKRWHTMSERIEFAFIAILLALPVVAWLIG